MTDWLESCYREHSKRLFRLAWLVLRDVAAAEDAVHSAFVRLVALKDPPENIAAFVLRAVRNAAIDERRRRRRQATELLVESHRITAAPSFGESRLELEETLMSLTEAQREVVEFRLRLGMSFREISELLHEPLSTVSSRYQRAIDHLQKNLEVHDERT